jgi:hypothetical protein
MPSPTRPNRRGNAVYTALSMVTLMGFAALTVDIGRDRVAQAELQNGVDAGVHAAARVLVAGDTASYDRAKAVGAAVANETTVLGTPLGESSDAFTAANFEIGLWNPTTRAFTVTNTNPNAVRVVNKRVAVPMLFGAAAMGAGTTLTAGASSTAMATGGIASHVACPLPFAIPDCYFNGSGAAHTQAWTIQSNTADNIAWALPTGVTGADAVRGMLTGSNCGSGARIGHNMVDLNNGMIASAYSDLRDMMIGNVVGATSVPATSIWETANWGAVPTTRVAHSGMPTTRFVGGAGHVGTGALMAGPIMLFNSGTDGYTCPTSASATWNQTRDITGFAWAVIYDVGGTTGSDRTISITIDFTGQHAAGDEAMAVPNGVNGGVTAFGAPLIVQ